MNNLQTPIIDDRLLYRRQYFIGPKFIERFPTWNKNKVGKLCITTHPDLEIEKVKKGNIELFLLGFVFDFKNPLFTNKQVLESIIYKVKSFNDLALATYQLSGRWIIIYSNGSEQKLLNDPGGLRQVFYYNDGKNIWGAAQPHLLAQLFNKDRRIDKDVLSLINSNAYNLYERSWVGNDTLYDDIFHLTPNHFLNLNNGFEKRYWPNKDLPNLGIEEVVSKSTQIITELLKAANNRYKTAQILTAGWDTRLLLALNKTQIKNQYFFIHKLPNMTNTHEDIIIPTEIADKFKLNFDIINCTNYNTDYDEIISKNVYLIQSSKKKYQYFNYLSQFENKLIISGNASPLIKEQYPKTDEINVENLARLMNYQNNVFAKKAISLWLDKTKNIVKDYNIGIENLFYWELRFSSWAPMYNAELDIATEEFSPYNCRDLIILMNSMPAEYRSKPDVILYKKIINKTWSELLDFPINPQSYSKKSINNNRFVKFIMNTLRKIRIYNFVRNFYRKYILK